MSTKKKSPILDPAAAANQRVLAEREERIKQQQLADAPIDLGLGLKDEPRSATVDEFLRDEWDKKVFGEPPKLTTRIIYGPDPIVNQCPAFHERLEKFGKEAVGRAFQELILKKGEDAATDAIMKKGLRASIAKFGAEATAQAFYRRIQAIPERVVEVEMDSELDPLLTDPMREAVARYAAPGMAVKFLSDRCMTVLGRRGYEIIRNEHGDPVKVGTLLMGWIPQEMADRRKRRWADESQSAVKETEENYYEIAARAVRDGHAAGLSPLEPGDTVTANPRLNDEYSGESRRSGFRLGDTEL